MEIRDNVITGPDGDTLPYTVPEPDEDSELATGPVIVFWLACVGSGAIAAVVIVTLARLVISLLP